MIDTGLNGYLTLPTMMVADMELPVVGEGEAVLVRWQRGCFRRVRRNSGLRRSTQIRRMRSSWCSLTGGHGPAGQAHLEHRNQPVAMQPTRAISSEKKAAARFRSCRRFLVRYGVVSIVL